MSLLRDKSTSVELVCLDDSIEDENNDKNVSVPNLAGMDTTTVIFDETLPPGVAPDGFIVIDEDVQSASEKPCEKSSDSGNPIFKVVFRDDAAFQDYHTKIEYFLKDLLQSKHRRKNIKSDKKDLVLEIFDSSSSHRHSLDRTDDKAKQTNDSLFMIDTEPKLQDDLDIPMYGKKFNITLQTSSEESSKEKEDCAPKMTCFNCLGNHSLRDCDQPRNYAEISKNRKEHNSKRGSASSRYHLDDDQRFGHFVPGQLTPQLREALGLRENELPRYIYRMRVLGYPPGWLEEARVQHSGLSLIGQNGAVEGGSDEEGEIVLPGDKDQYDIKKIVDFPGFNVLPAEGTLDEYEQYWGSPAQEYHSKNAMITFFSKRQVDDGYKRKKLPNPANMRVSTDLNSGEMDVDEIEEVPVECLPVKNLFVPPLPKDDILNLPPPPPPPPENLECQSLPNAATNTTDENTPRGSSPSLFDLEFQKRKLMAELNEANSKSNPASPINISDSSMNEDKAEENSLKTKEFATDSLKTDKPQSENKNVHSEDSASTPSHKSSTLVHLGTPILYSASPFKRLPPSEKFSKDICDVINFENLPDSTGKYDQMAELLQKVRTRVSEIQKE